MYSRGLLIAPTIIAPTTIVPTIIVPTIIAKTIIAPTIITLTTIVPTIIAPTPKMTSLIFNRPKCRSMQLKIIEKHLKGLNQAKIIKKSFILFWLLNMAI